MKGRVSEWLEETHGVNFELTRHFLGRLFDSEIVTTPGEWSKVVIGIFAAALSASILLIPIYVGKYSGALQSFRPILDNRQLYIQAVRNDELAFTTLAMAITAILTALLWQSFFPGLRDYLALAALPIRPRQLIAAKCRVIAMLFGVFILLLTAVPAVAFAAITQGHGVDSPWHGLATFLAWGGSCAFVFFGLVAVQGVLLNLLSPRWFARVSEFAPGAILAAAMWQLSYLDLQPKSSFWPSNWFVDLWAAIAGLPHGQKYPGMLGLTFAPLIAGAVYAISARRYRSLIVEARLQPESTGPHFGDWLIRRWIDDPREQAMFSFMWKSILRSRTHRLILCACAGLWASLNFRIVSGENSSSDRFGAGLIFGPITMAIVAIMGLHYLFSVPTALKANWIFRISECEGRTSWLHGVERFVLWCGVAPMFLIWLPFAIWALGAGAAAIYLPGLAFVLLAYEISFYAWKKAPFTCSYLPGRHPMWQLIVLGLPGLIGVAIVAYVISLGASIPPVFFLVLTVLTVAWRRARARRLREWRVRPLIYEEGPENDIEALHLHSDAAADVRASRIRAAATDIDDDSEALWIPGPVGERADFRIRRWLRDLPIDLNHGVRLLATNKGFAATAIVTLGLGLGLNAAFFTVFDAFCLRPSAVRDASSLFEYQETVPAEAGQGRETRPAKADFREFQNLQATTGILAGAIARSQVVTRLVGVRSSGLMVSGNYFFLLGAQAKLGALIGESDDLPVMVLSYRTWQYRFGGDATIVGRKIAVQGLDYSVIGVAQPGFTGVASDLQPDFWIPLSTWQMLKQTILEPQALSVVVKLKTGVSRPAADRALLDWLHENSPERKAVNVELSPVTTEVGASEVSGLTFAFLLVFFFTLAIPCVNVANMMLARGLARQREIGVRIALGAGRGRIVRQFLTEGFVLAALGGILGVAFTVATVQAAQRTLYLTLPSLPYLEDLQMRMPDFEINWRVLLYSAAVTIFTAIAFALTPALQATRRGIADALRCESFGIPERWLRNASVVGQVALCLMLLSCSLLMLRGVWRATSFDPGFSARDVHAVGWALQPMPLTIESGLRSQDWVEAVGTAISDPFSMRHIRVWPEDLKLSYRVRYNLISPDYFSVLGIPLLRGRMFTPEEASSRAPVAIVSEGMANQLWPGARDVIGQTFALDLEGRPPSPIEPAFGQARVIGVTRERMRGSSGWSDPSNAYFPERMQGMGLFVRGRGDAKQTTLRLQRFLAKAAPMGVATVSFQDYIYFQHYGARAGSLLASVLGVIALVLTVSSIYGVMSFLARQRMREMGIRSALGASKQSLMRLMLSNSLRLVLLGSVLGLILAAWGAQLISSMTEYIYVYDWPAYGEGLAVVALATMATALAPSWRAAQVNPGDILRSD